MQIKPILCNQEVSMAYRRSENTLLPLKIFNRTPFSQAHVAANIDEESQRKVNDDRGAHSNEGDVNKKQPDLGSSYSHDIANIRAHTKSPNFKETFQIVEQPCHIKPF